MRDRRKMGGREVKKKKHSGGKSVATVWKAAEIRASEEKNGCRCAWLHLH